MTLGGPYEGPLLVTDAKKVILQKWLAGYPRRSEANRVSLHVLFVETAGHALAHKKREKRTKARNIKKPPLQRNLTNQNSFREGRLGH